MGSPSTWAEIAERLGIPFAILLLMIFVAATAAYAFHRSVVVPMSKAFIKMIEKLEKCNTLNAKSLQQLSRSNERTSRAMEHLATVTEQHLTPLTDVVESNKRHIVNNEKWIETLKATLSAKGIQLPDKLP